MARQTLEGLKGSIRKFMTPVSESKFDGDVINFKDSGSVELPFTLNNVNLGSAKQDDNVLNQQSGNERFKTKFESFTVSEVELSNIYYQQFAPTIPSGFRIKNGSVKVNVNGIKQISNIDQTISSSVDFQIDSNQTKVRLRKQQLGDDFGLGITLITGSLYSDNPSIPTQSGTGQPDRVNIRFQLENS